MVFTWWEIAILLIASGLWSERLYLKGQEDILREIQSRYQKLLEAAYMKGAEDGYIHTVKTLHDKKFLKDEEQLKKENLIT